MYVASKVDLKYISNNRFLSSRIETLRVLLIMRQQACVYNCPPCDCKYGKKEPFENGEASGCPELATAAALLARMDDREYAEIMKRKPLYLQDFSGANT